MKVAKIMVAGTPGRSVRMGGIAVDAAIGGGALVLYTQESWASLWQYHTYWGEFQSDRLYLPQQGY